MIEKKDVINLLDTIADMLEFRGENSFKVNAYRFGAIAIRKLDQDINEVVFRKELNKIKGIGKGLEAVLYEYFDLGYSIMLEELKQGIPEGVGDLMKIKGLGPRKISHLYSELQISNIDDLEQAAHQNKIAPLKGFGENLQTGILEEVTRIRKNAGYLLLNNALDYTSEIESRLKTFPSVTEVHVTGDIRRGKEVINTIEFLLQIKSQAEFEQDFKYYPNSEKDENTYLFSETYMPLVKLFTSTKKFTSMDHLKHTGSDAFIKKLGTIKSGKFASEEAVFKSLSIPYVIPEMREIEYFGNNQPVNSNIVREDLKGLLHFHTTFSDGRNTLQEMLAGAKSKGFSYAFVCDHSKSAFYANGLNEERILLQNKEIQAVSKKIDIPVWQGIESDILADGSLDYGDEVLKTFKLIVASVHSRFKMNKNEMTARIIKAVENPYTDILGHPSGRLLLMREPYEFDVHKVLDACAANRVAVEINSNPRRLDLDWRYLYYARKKGCFITINSDAHSISELDLVKYGVMMGRKAGLLNEEVINCFDTEKFINFLNVKRKRI